MKKTDIISTAWKANPSNTFIRYDFFDQLEKVFQEYSVPDEDKIYNCDESGFPTVQTSVHVVSVMRQRALKLPFGARRENNTILEVCSANGIPCNPIIIFKSKDFMTSCVGENALPNTYYDHSENDWMDSVTFAKWFEIFAETIKDRPLLLLFHGHLTHITIPFITRALEESIIILKFLP